MAMLEAASRALIAGFSTPLDEWDGEVVSAWLTLRVQQRARDLAADLRLRDALHSGLGQAIDAGAARASTMAEIWHPATGVVLKHRRYARRSDHAAAELALYWHELGVPGSWTLPASGDDDPRTSHFGGYRVEGRLAGFEGDGERAILETEDGRLYRFQRVGGEWETADAVRVRYQCHGPIAVEQWPMRARCDDRDGGIPATPEYAARLAGALERLRADAPRHHHWITRIVRLCLPLQRIGKTIASWSSAEYPGLIALCANGSELEIGETLIHEAAHQHFHALKQFGDLIEPESEETAWSPVKRCRRPIEMLLLSYHAFANVQLFYRELLCTGKIGPESYLSHCATLLDWRPELEGALRESRSLTPMGQLLWQHLSARLDEDR